MKKLLMAALITCFAIGTATAAGNLEVNSLSVSLPNQDAETAVNLVLNEVHNGGLGRGRAFLSGLSEAANYTMTMEQMFVDDEYISIRVQEHMCPGGIHVNSKVLGLVFSLRDGRSMRLVDYATESADYVAAKVEHDTANYMQELGYDYDVVKLADVAMKGWYAFYLNADGIPVVVFDAGILSDNIQVPVEVPLY